MKAPMDVQRLIESEAPGAELLRSARSDAPNPGSQQALLAALAVAGAVTASSAGASAAPAGLVAKAGGTLTATAGAATKLAVPLAAKVFLATAIAIAAGGSGAYVYHATTNGASGRATVPPPSSTPALTKVGEGAKKTDKIGTMPASQLPFEEPQAIPVEALPPAAPTSSVRSNSRVKPIDDVGTPAALEPAPTAAALAEGTPSAVASAGVAPPTTVRLTAGASPTLREENARIEQIHTLLQAGDRAGARREIERYSVDFPNGFFRSDLPRLRARAQ